MYWKSAHLFPGWQCSFLRRTFNVSRESFTWTLWTAVNLGEFSRRCSQEQPFYSVKDVLEVFNPKKLVKGAAKIMWVELWTKESISNYELSGWNIWRCSRFTYRTHNDGSPSNVRFDKAVMLLLARFLTKKITLLQATNRHLDVSIKNFSQHLFMLGVVSSNNEQIIHCIKGHLTKSLTTFFALFATFWNSPNFDTV